MSPKLTIAYESADASPTPAANPGDRIDAMFEAAEERHRAARFPCCCERWCIWARC